MGHSSSHPIQPSIPMLPPSTRHYSNGCNYGDKPWIHCRSVKKWSLEASEVQAPDLRQALPRVVDPMAAPPPTPSLRDQGFNRLKRASIGLRTSPIITRLTGPTLMRCLAFETIRIPKLGCSGYSTSLNPSRNWTTGTYTTKEVGRLLRLLATGEVLLPHTRAPRDLPR
jgi:hypothetical protein